VYTPGFTFTSLIVAIACMFLSFGFVCSTDEVQTIRILMSGVIAGVRVLYYMEIATNSSTHHSFAPST
jgi:NO-binding membrane sensor protein with MHYT domain